MNADVINIADAMVVVLNGATLSQTFSAERVWLIVQELPTLAGLKVTVIPAMVAIRAFDLKPRRAFDWSIAIAVQKRLASSAKEYVDPMILLVQEIIDLFVPGAYFANKTANVQSLEAMPLYNPDKLDTQGLFESLITVTFHLSR